MNFMCFMVKLPNSGLKYVACMQRSGIRDWRGSELPGLRYAPSGLSCLGAPKAGSGSGRIHQREKCGIEGNGADNNRQAAPLCGAI